MSLVDTEIMRKYTFILPVRSVINFSREKKIILTGNRTMDL